MARPSPTRLVDAYATSTLTTRRRVQAAVGATWGQLDSWHEPDIDRFAARVAPIVAGGQRQIAALTDGYIAAMTATQTGTGRPVGIPTKMTTDLAMRGVSAVDVYRRMGPTVWTALALGRSLREAVGEGLTRALVTAGTDLQLAKTHSARYVMERNDKVVGYERVPDGEACELCLLASTQRYHVGDLMPIHDRCSCDVEPIYGDRDPGHVIDPELLAQIKGVDFAVHEHGELGPVLTVAGHHFDGPDDVD